MRRYCLLLAILVMAIRVDAAQLPPINEIMSAGELDATGLDKLSPAELQTLREWMEVFIKRDAKFVMRHYKGDPASEKPVNEVSGLGAQGIESGEPGKASGASREAVRSEENSFNEIRSSIDGNFTGWSGPTRFTLANGQVWQQRNPDGHRRVKTLANPDVILTKNFLGQYVMKVPLAKIKVPVKRVK